MIVIIINVKKVYECLVLHTKKKKGRKFAPLFAHDLFKKKRKKELRRIVTKDIIYTCNFVCVYNVYGHNSTVFFFFSFRRPYSFHNFKSGRGPVKI